MADFVYNTLGWKYDHSPEFFAAQTTLWEDRKDIGGQLRINSQAFTRTQFTTSDKYYMGMQFDELTKVILVTYNITETWSNPTSDTKYIPAVFTDINNDKDTATLLYTVGTATEPAIGAGIMCATPFIIPAGDAFGFEFTTTPSTFDYNGLKLYVNLFCITED